MMTDLLSPTSTRPSGRAADGSPTDRRPLALGALMAGVGAPAVALSLLWFVGLVGWYADDGGSHGTTRSVLRIGADAWLLAHGSPLSLRLVAITASPLGVTALCGVLTYRLARRAAAASEVEDLRAVGLGTIVLSGCYAAVALLTAVLAGAPVAEPGLGKAFLGGAVVGALFGGAGLLRGAGRAGELRRLIPVPALSVGYAALTTLLLMVALGALLTVIGLVVHWSAATAVVDGLEIDLTGGLLSLLLLVAIAPNIVVLASTYLLGSGFAVGTGTLVSPAEVTLGPVPSVPVLAALPDDGWAPGWAVALIAVPFVVALTAGLLTGRAVPTSSYQSAAGRGLGGGFAAAVLLTVAASVAGGSIGPGRMADVGISVGETLTAALVPLGLGSLLGAVAATWWTRRSGVPDACHPAPVAAPPTTGNDDATGPVPLPRVTGPTPTDLTTEQTVQLRLPDQHSLPDQRRGKGPSAR
jgi:hypothetical protein